MSGARPTSRLALRLALSFLLPTVLGLAAIGVVADVVARRAFEGQLSLRLISVAQAERATLSGYFAELVGRVEGADERSLTNLRNRISRIAEETGVRRVFLFDPDTGESIVDTDEEIAFGTRYWELEADRVEVLAAADGESTASVLYTAEDGTPYKYAYAPLYDDAGNLVAVIGVEGASDHLSDLQEVRRNLVLLGVLVVLILIGTAVVVSRRITAPVHRLGAAARRIGDGDLESPVAQTRTDELGQLEHAVDKMRLALRDREEELQMMLSGIAHEVRNPLGGIELFLGLLDEDLAAEGREDEDALRGHVKTMSRELEYLGRVVKEFLEFARRSQIEVSRVGAREFCSEIESLMAGDLMARDVGLDLVFEPEDIELTVDCDRIKRVLVNLVRNAWQASDEGDRIALHVDAPDPATRRIRVTDEGAGIPSDKLVDIFRPFFTTREKGTGLGLPLARKVVEAHGGTLEISSEVGLGTTLELLVPFDDALETKKTVMNIPDGWLG